MQEEIFNKSSKVLEDITNSKPIDEMLKDNNISYNQFMELCNRFDNIKTMAMIRYRLNDFKEKQTIKNRKITIKDLK